MMMSQQKMHMIMCIFSTVVDLLLLTSSVKKKHDDESAKNAHEACVHCVVSGSGGNAFCRFPPLSLEIVCPGWRCNKNHDDDYRYPVPKETYGESTGSNKRTLKR